MEVIDYYKQLQLIRRSGDHYKITTTEVVVTTNTVVIMLHLSRNIIMCNREICYELTFGHKYI